MQGAFSFAAQAIEEESNAADRGRGRGVSIKNGCAKSGARTWIGIGWMAKEYIYINGLEKAPD